MTEARILREVAKSLRAIQIRAVVAKSSKADAFLATAVRALHEMAMEAEKNERPQAQTVEEMMKRLREREG